MFSYFIPITIGLLIILQSTLNKEIAHSHGLAFATLCNILVSLVFSFIFYCFCRSFPEVISKNLLGNADTFYLKWWYILPGTIGFFVVAGLAFSLFKLPASYVFVLLVAAQLFGAVLWDVFIDKIPIAPMQILGILMAIVGTFLVTSYKQSSI